MTKFQGCTRLAVCVQTRISPGPVCADLLSTLTVLINGGRTRLSLKGSFSYTCPLCHYTHISTSAPLSFIISICMCMCQDGVTRVGHAHTTCSAARCAATSTVHASPVRRSPDTVSNRGVVAACASQISSFTLFSQRAESVNVLAHPRKKGNVVHASEAPHQTDTSRIRLPATSLLHLFTCFLQTTSYVSPE